MSVIKWQKCYEMGIATFDGEHHTLVGVILMIYTIRCVKSGVMMP